MRKLTSGTLLRDCWANHSNGTEVKVDRCIHVRRRGMTAGTATSESKVCDLSMQLSELIRQEMTI